MSKSFSRLHNKVNIKKRFPASYWMSMENRQKFLNEIAIKLNLKEPSDWGKVSTRYITQSGGSTLLQNYYNGSLFQCLQSVYKETNWKKEWFLNIPPVPLLYWNSMENRKKFLDSIANKLNIKKPSDWGRISARYIYELGGTTLLKNKYNGSLFECLQSVYKDLKWKKEWFVHIPRFPKSHWYSQENCRKFMEEIATTYNIQTINDWRRVTHSLLRNKGGSGLLQKYEYSIVGILEELYPSYNWEESIDSKLKVANTELVTQNKCLILKATSWNSPW